VAGHSDIQGDIQADVQTDVQTDVQRGGAAPDSFDYRESAAAPPWHFVTSAPLQIGICSHSPPAALPTRAGADGPRSC